MSQQSIKLSLSYYERKIVAEWLPDFAGHLELSSKNARTLSFTLPELQQLLHAAKNDLSNHRYMRQRAQHKIIASAMQAIEDSQGIGAIPTAERLYQFRIALKQSKPEIWRRIQIKNCTLDKLHEHIQIAMGWTNSHLHDFQINGQCYGDPELLDDDFESDVFVDSTVLKIDKIVPKSGKRFRFDYRYDFGDCWQHEILFEGCLKAEKGRRYPICVEGERACPPEDVGGTHGFARYLKATSDPTHRAHKEMLEWNGPFDPMNFDSERTTRRMQRGLPDWRKADSDEFVY